MIWEGMELGGMALGFSILSRMQVDGKCLAIVWL